MICLMIMLKSDRTCFQKFNNKETRPVVELGNVLSFLNKHLIFEYVNFYLNSHSYFQQNFVEFGKKMVQSNGQVN